MDSVWKGRGTSVNPDNRFETIGRAADLPEYRDDILDPDDVPVAPRTQVLIDNSKSILSQNQSPDVGFEFSVNPYRGCEHGCVYCYARPTHEYLGFSSGLDFETKILVKPKAAELLRKELLRPSWEPQAIAFSGNTDCYQPLERKMRLTRHCLEVLAEFRNPAFIITKNFLVTRDLDILQELNRYGAIAVYLSVTTLDDKLCEILEPRTSRPRKRLETISRLAAAGIPVGVNVGPVIAGITEHELGNILKAAREAGASSASYIMMRLPHQVKELFTTWLETHFPDRKDKVLNRIRDLRGGELNDPNFGSRMKGEGVYAEQVRAQYKLWRRKFGFNENKTSLNTEAFRRPPQLGDQLALFES